MLDRPFSVVAPRPWLRPRFVVGGHLIVVGVGSLALLRADQIWLEIVGAIVVGTSFFALSRLIHDASHHQLARQHGWNDALGMLAGWPFLTPLSAYRAFEAAHRQATNHDEDPHQPLNSRWMLAVGAVGAVVLVHWYAARMLRGRALLRYGLETAGMVAAVALICAMIGSLSHHGGLWLALLVALCWQNVWIVAGHLDLPTGRFLDTWQLALPTALSRWLLHADHHLEQHLRPGLRWHELPVYRAEIVRGGFVPPANQVVALDLARLCRKRRPAVATPLPWAGRAAIRARPRRPNHPTRDSVG